MRLDPIDEALLDGSLGAAAAQAMRLLRRYGDAMEADCFVSIASAHIDGCLYHGPSSIDFVQRFVDVAGKVRVPTTLNVAAIDLLHPEWYPGREEMSAAQTELIRLHESLGCVPTLTCAPYQRMQRPRQGDHVAWAESNAICFVNSVLGARTDRYGDFTDLCAALTGRVPLAGFHRDENRRATLIIELPGIEAMRIERDLYFAAAGYAVGTASGTRIPLLIGLPMDATEDELKALGTAAATSGSVALFHALGVTPEAADERDVTAGSAALPRHPIAAADLAALLDRLCPVEVGEKVAAVCLGTPHFSIAEFERLACAAEGAVKHPDVEFYVSTSREIAEMVRLEPRFAGLLRFGIELVVDTCTYVTPVVRRQQGAILTNSAKWVHYAPGNIGRSAGLMPLERCIRSAVTGRVESA